MPPHGKEYTYFKVDWHHDFVEEPVRLYSELDADRWEVRKVEVFRDGKLGFAGNEIEFRGTRLGDQQIPSEAEIAKDPQFSSTEIDEAEFNEIWALASDACR